MPPVNTELLLSIIGEQQVTIRLLQKEIMVLREGFKDQAKPKAPSEPVPREFIAHHPV